MVLDPALTASKDVIGFDVVPGVARMVHHILLFTADKADAQSVDDGEAGPGWTCFGGPGTQNPEVVGGWVPGTTATKYPAGTGIRIQTGKVLVMQVHYNMANGPPVPDRTQVKFQYATSPVPKPATIFPQAQQTFSIPPGAKGYSVTDVGSAIPAAVTVYGVIPHMHTLGRKIRAEIQNGPCLVDIPAWDFHWQASYLFKTPISAPFGSKPVLTCTWDNPTSNPVTWGEKTTDEMCLAYYYVTVP
jgi:hypothetical protein